MTTRARPKNRTARAGVPLAVQAMEGKFAPKRIDSAALHEQLSYRAAGNPPGTLPTTAISNCFPGLELDFRNVWKNLFAGIEMHEADNLVVGTDQEHENLRFHRLQKVIIPGGKKVICEFTTDREDDPVAPDVKTIRVTMQVRNFFEPGSAVIARDLVEPGQLTQSLCSPWQNDYRECACYYWAASRPDYVNVEIGPQGTSIGENWMQKRGSGSKQYQPDDFDSPGLLSYEDIFRKWETVLRFEIAGQDTD